MPLCQTQGVWHNHSKLLLICVGAKQHEWYCIARSIWRTWTDGHVTTDTKSVHVLVVPMYVENDLKILL